MRYTHSRAFVIRAYKLQTHEMLFDMLIILQTLRVVLWPGGVR